MSSPSRTDAQTIAHPPVESPHGGEANLEPSGSGSSVTVDDRWSSNDHASTSEIVADELSLPEGGESRVSFDRASIPQDQRDAKDGGIHSSVRSSAPSVSQRTRLSSIGVGATPHRSGAGNHS